MELDDRIEAFISSLKQHKMSGSYAVAEASVQLLRVVISSSKWGNAKELVDLIKSVGTRILNAEPSEVIVGNMVQYLQHVFHM